MIHVSSHPANDLVLVMQESGIAFQRHDTPEQAVGAAPDASGVMLLADGYPETTQTLSEEFFDVRCLLANLRTTGPHEWVWTNGMQQEERHDCAARE